MRHALWNPWRELDQLHSQFNRMFSGRSFVPSGVNPAVNLWQSEHGFVLTAELPDINPDEVEITVNRNVVTIRGNRPSEKLEENATWVRHERSDAAFHRAIELPEEVDAQSAEASYEKGVLTVKLARPAEKRPTKLTVRRG